MSEKTYTAGQVKALAVSGCLFISLALVAGYTIGEEAGHTRGTYEAWHEADTWAENVHHACMKARRSRRHEHAG